MDPRGPGAAPMVPPTLLSPPALGHTLCRVQCVSTEGTADGRSRSPQMQEKGKGQDRERP